MYLLIVKAQKQIQVRQQTTNAITRIVHLRMRLARKPEVSRKRCRISLVGLFGSFLAVAYVISLTLLLLRSKRTTAATRASIQQQQESCRQTQGFDVEMESRRLHNLLSCQSAKPSTSGAITALNLFCDLGTPIEIEKPVDRHGHQILWEIWRRISSALDPTLLRTILEIGVPTQATLLDKHHVQLWAPANDEGLTTVLEELNKGNGIAEYNVESLTGWLGPDKLFVDAGSNLGLVSLSILLEYPGTTVASVEAAAPTWVYQLLNIGLNVPETVFCEHYYAFQAGLGSTELEYSSFPMMWRPHSTTSTRGWTPSHEKRSNDIELQVPLRSLRTLFQSTFRFANHKPSSPVKIDVLKVDCEGCEYNMVPDFSPEEFSSISCIVGEVHWGYIPSSKKPSSHRAAATHARLCQHENFARQAKECCAFPELTLQSNNPVTQKMSSELCRGFDAWARGNELLTVPDDSRWLDTSKAMA